MTDVVDATFATDVLERSNSVPVVVDLWAPWCGPCKSLGPILEKVIGETDGLVELAKINVDENPEVSKAFHVQSIPAVYAMRNGQVVDGFMGAVGEPEVVAFVQRLLDATGSGDEAEDANADGTDADGSDATGDTGGAGAPDSGSEQAPAGAQAGDAGAVIVDSVGQVTDIAAAAPAAAKTTEEVAGIEAELETLLLSVKSDDAARERFIALLDELGPEHPETNTWRRRLATALF